MADGHLEAELVAVDGVELAVVQRDADIDHGKAERALGHVLLGAGLDGRDVLLGHRAADDLVVEGEALAALGSGRMSILTSPNWPWPPDCFLWRPCALVPFLMVSL